MKNEKKRRGFSFDKNIANFEAFCRDKNFSKNLLFLRSDWSSIFNNNFDIYCVSNIFNSQEPNV